MLTEGVRDKSCRFPFASVRKTVSFPTSLKGAARITCGAVYLIRAIPKIIFPVSGLQKSCLSFSRAPFSSLLT